MVYDKVADIIDKAEEDLKSKFSMEGQLFQRDEYGESFGIDIIF